MPDPPVIKTSLAERIAKLNATTGTGSPDRATASPSTASPTTPVSLPGQIKQKISKYELTGQGEAPLVPKGSFGFGAPMTKGDRNLDRMRIASLGVSGGLTPRSSSPAGERSASPILRSVSSKAVLNTSTFVNVARSDSNDSASASPILLNSIPKGLGLKEFDLESVNSLQVEVAGSQRSSSSIISESNGTRLQTPPPEERNHQVQVEQTRQELENFENEESDLPASPHDVDKLTRVSKDQNLQDGKPMEPPESDITSPPPPPSQPTSSVLPSVTLPKSSSPMLTRDISSFHGAIDLDQDLSSMKLDDTLLHHVEPTIAATPLSNQQPAAVHESSPVPSDDYETTREDVETTYHTDDSVPDGSQYALSDILENGSDVNVDTIDGSHKKEMTLTPNDNDASKKTSIDVDEVNGAELDEHGMPLVKCSSCGASVSLMELGDHICSPTQHVKEASHTSPTIDSTQFESPITPRGIPDSRMPSNVDDEEEEEETVVQVRPLPKDVPQDLDEDSEDQIERLASNNDDDEDLDVTSPQSLRQSTSSQPNCSWRQMPDVPESIDPTTPDSPFSRHSNASSSPINGLGGADSTMFPRPATPTENFKPEGWATTTSQFPQQVVDSSTTMKKSGGGAMWLDEEYDPSEGTGYATIVRSTRS